MSGILQWENTGDDITREHIAVKMMILQFKADQGKCSGRIPPTKEQMAKSAVEYADALLAELKRRKEPQP